MGGPTVQSRRQRIRSLPTLTPTVLAVAMPAPTLPSPSQAAPVPAESVAPTVVPPTAAPPPGNAPAAPAGDQSSAGSTLAALVNLNVRTGPSVDYPVVGSLAQGQSAQIVGKNPEGTWWQIVYPPGSGSLAWVSADSQYSTVNAVEAVQIAQLPPPPPPTATPPPPPAAPPPPLSAVQPTVPAGQPTPTPLPLGSPNAGPTATPILTSPGWAFTAVNVLPNQEDGSGLILYGNLINNTTAPQELLYVNGTFYDEQGQVIASADNTYAYWPAYVVPPGGGMPFELYVDGINGAARFDLNAEAEPSSDVPRQDLQFSDVNQINEDDAYCVQARLDTPPDDFEQYVIIAMIVYDSQGKVIGFGDYAEFGSNMSEDALEFEICINPPTQEVAQYELRAWGL